MYFKSIIVASLSIWTATAATTTTEKHLSVSRCFFVFAPLLEHAKKSNNEKLESYAILRLFYIKGYMENLADDAAFKNIFSSNLSKNQSDGILIANTLKNASSNNDNAAINKEIRKGEACDKELGIKTK